MVLEKWLADWTACVDGLSLIHISAIDPEISEWGNLLEQTSSIHT